MVVAKQGFGQFGEELADCGKGVGIGGRVGAGGAADGLLVDADDLVEMLDKDINEVRRRVEALANDMRGLGMELRLSTEEYGSERDFDGTITRSITFNFKVLQQD